MLFNNYFSTRKLIILGASLTLSISGFGQNNTSLSAGESADTDTTAKPICKVEKLGYHFQTTVISQRHLDFSAPYSSTNSLQTSEKQRLSVTSTLYMGCRLWKNAEIYFNPELSGGQGLSQTRGIAGFTNGETFRIGEAQPVVSLSRIFIRQHIPIGASTDVVEDGQNQLAGKLPTERVTITFGKYSVTDIFDINSYSHDPRTQFMNWSLMSGGAWDYPANTRGYTYGLTAELIKKNWSIKGAVTMTPETANGPYMDMNIGNAHSETLEFDKNVNINNKKGVVRLIGFYTQGNMGNYADAIKNRIYSFDIVSTRSYAHSKGGFVVNAEQELGKYVGWFGRLSWNDGKNETWAFTEIDQSFHTGLHVDGAILKLKQSSAGVAVVVNGLSDDHKKYLQSGGYGFMLGDGKLNYGYECIGELYVNYLFRAGFWISGDYQAVLNPGYNQDRGPLVHVFALRGHLEI